MTAFCIEAFKLLSQDPVETTNGLLRVLVLQQLGNVTSSQATQAFDDSFVPASYGIQINVLHFISLTLALSVSSVCILGKQWIREFQRDMAVSARDALRVRQARFDALHAWRVPQILAALPVILQIALLLFFAGLLTQLWNTSDQKPAGVVSAIVGLTLLMVLVTTVAPAHFKDQTFNGPFTPFRSPQAWIYFVVAQSARLALRNIFSWINLFRHEHQEHRAEDVFASWIDLDHRFLSDEIAHPRSLNVTSIHSSLRWILKVIGNTEEIEGAVLWSLLPQFHPRNLVHSPSQLAQYVLSRDIPNTTDEKNLPRLYYQYATSFRDQHRDNGSMGMDSMIQINLLGTTTFHALDALAKGDSSNDQDTWDVATDSCRKMFTVVERNLSVGNFPHDLIRGGEFLTLLIFYALCLRHLCRDSQIVPALGRPAYEVSCQCLVGQWVACISQS